MIIGISGPAGAGKDTAAELLVKNHGFGRIGLADGLKRICKDVFSFSDEQLWGPSSQRNAQDKRYPRNHSFRYGTCTCCGMVLYKEGVESSVCYLTPRYALQQLGTEWGRGCYDDLWIEEAIRTAQYIINDRSMVYSAFVGIHDLTGTCSASFMPWRSCYCAVKGVVFSDIRFRNEMEQVKKAGGKLIRLKRDSSLSGTASLHQSEVEMKEIGDDEFDYVIQNNDTTLEQLELEVSKAYTALC